MKIDINLLKNMTVLMAEDDPFVRESFAQILTPYFATVLVAPDGEKALHYFDNYVVHIVILDISMPRRNGLDVAATIRQKDHDIPVIMVTCHSEVQYMQQAVRLRLMDYLIKPITIASLETTFKRSLIEMNQRGQLEFRFASGALFKRLTQEIEWNGKLQTLTKNEAVFLDLMLRNQRHVVSFERITDTLSENNEDFSAAALRNLIYRLRRKVGAESVLTHHDIGYVVP